MAYTTIDDPTIHFNTKLYTGNGGSQTITGVGFKPDWTWWKSRDAGNSHALVDIVRGTNKVLYSDSTSTEQPISAQTFNSDGYAIVQDAGANSINSNGSTKVGWSWLAGGSQGSSNTDGSINTTYTSANTTSGFSISTYTGTGSAATIGHGLGAKPAMIMVKRLNASAEAWVVYHQSLGGGTTPQDKYLHLNSSDAEGDSAGMWNDTAPTTSLFSVGSTGVSNGSGGTFVAYCFAEKQGYSKFGSYVGNGNADGSFIYTGFKPAFVIIKESNGTNSWQMWDNKRPGYNLTDKYLQPNTTSAEISGNNQIDILSTGIKLRSSNTANNGNGQSFIYMAFAESPFVSSSGVPTTAR